MPAIIPRTVLGKNEVNFEASRAIPPVPMLVFWFAFSFEPKQQLLDKGQRRGARKKAGKEE